MMWSWFFGKKKGDDSETDEETKESAELEKVSSNCKKEKKRTCSKQQPESDSDDSNCDENCDCGKRHRCCNKGRVSSVCVCIKPRVFILYNGLWGYF